MTDPAPEEMVSDSGGTMLRMSGPVRGAEPDLTLLESLRRVSTPGPVRPSGQPPYFEPGDVLGWHYGRSFDMLRVVRDDARGLVAWLPAGSERLAAFPRDGRGIRERPLAERAALSIAHDYEMRVVAWRGPGLLRIAPTGTPWSLWYFREEDGSFAGHYVNLELRHERPANGSCHVHTRDLLLDLWIEGQETWLKDSDELEAAEAAGWCTPEQGCVIRQVAEQARFALVGQHAWPMDESWEAWRPPAPWEQPLELPAAIGG